MNRKLENLFIACLVLGLDSIPEAYAVPGPTPNIAAASVSATVAPSTTMYFPPTSIYEAIVAPTSAYFPPVGSIPRNYSPNGLEEFWSLVGSVEAPPFTTTVVPTASVVLPSPPPPLYPAWYSPPKPADILSNYTFPEGFMFGVATSAYQVEGATKNEGKGPTNWDWASRQPGFIVDNSTADITALQYYLYKEDVVRAAALGVNAHSFSISWARIYPFGAAGSPVNQEGIDHYSDLIDYQLSMGVASVVTLFHWDLPLALQSYYGGFTSPQIVDDFANYAKTVFQAYNGRVKTWYTFNEPIIFCGSVGQYPFNSSLAPGVNSSNAQYHCAYYLLKAHAAAVKEFRALNISGEIAFKNNDFVGPPWRANNSDDELAAERHAAFGIGFYSDPVYTTGDWPPLMLETLPETYLPRFTAQDKEDILGSADFFAINSYAIQWTAAPPNGVSACVANMSDPMWPACNQVILYDSNTGWASGPLSDPATSSIMQATPQLLRYDLKQVHARWPTNKMYISEFGFDEPFESQRTEIFQIKEDVTRTNYFMTYLGEALLAIHEDGIPLMGAFSWSIVDDAEFSSGFSVPYGVQYVNFTTLERTYKRSAIQISEFFKAHLVSNPTV